MNFKLYATMTPDQANACLKSISKFLLRSYGYALHRFDHPTLRTLYPQLYGHVRTLLFFARLDGLR